MPKEWKVQNRQPARLRLGQHFGDALLHFRGGFIGKGNRGDGMRQIADIDNQMLDFLRNHAGFAAACASQNEGGCGGQVTAESCSGFKPCRRLGADSLGNMKRPSEKKWECDILKGNTKGRLKKMFQTAFALEAAD